MQKLEIYQSLWAMDFRNPNVPERGHARNFEIMAEAGYDGVCLDPAVSDLAKYEATLPYFEKYGLKSMVNLFPRRSRDMGVLLDFAQRASATKINVIGQVTPVSVAGAIPLIYRWMDQAEAKGMELLFETHRDSLLNDLYYTLEVLDAIPERASVAHDVKALVRRFGECPALEHDVMLYVFLLSAEDRKSTRLNSSH